MKFIVAILCTLIGMGMLWGALYFMYPEVYDIPLNALLVWVGISTLFMFIFAWFSTTEDEMHQPNFNQDKSRYEQAYAEWREKYYDEMADYHKNPRDKNWEVPRPSYADWNIQPPRKSDFIQRPSKK